MQIHLFHSVIVAQAMLNLGMCMGADGYQPAAFLPAHGENVWCVALSLDGKLAATGSFDKTIKLWDIERKEERITLTGHTQIVRSVSFTPEGQLLLSVDQKTVRCWSAVTGASKWALDVSGANAVLPVNETAAVVLTDSAVLVSLDDGKSFRRFDQDAFPPVDSLAADYSKHVFVVKRNSLERFALTGMLESKFTGEWKTAADICVSHDGKYVAVLGDRMLSVIDVPRNQLMWTRPFRELWSEVVFKRG